jgi:hypothetical protein
MSGAAKLAAFAVVLALVFGGAALAGGAIDPERDDEDTTMSSNHTPTEQTDAHGTTTAPDSGAHGGDTTAAQAGHGAGGATGSDDHGASGAKSGAGHGAHGGASADEVRGLSVSDGGLRVVVERPELRRGAQETIAFRVVNADGETVRDFDVAHEKRMHLIVARRDLTGFQHLHPQQQDDGSWTAPATFGEAGSYRLFADFTRGGEASTLASDLRVDGDADLRPLPAPAAETTSDGGETVTLSGADHLHAGEPATLEFTIADDGKPVAVQPYLGASGHLVALRDGDLAFLHVHPSGDGVSFETAFPTAGAYRLFLQVKVDGEVRTAAFTVEVEP